MNPAQVLRRAIGNTQADYFRHFVGVRQDWPLRVAQRQPTRKEC